MSKIIFTTKDGYDITEGMKYYSVKVKEYETHPSIKKLKGFKTPPLWSMCGPYINPEAHNPTGDIVYFYKKENAIEFINQNKTKMSKEITVEEFYKGFETFIKNNEEKYRTGTPLDIITEKGIPKQQISFFMGKSKLPNMMEDYIKLLKQK